MIPDPPENLRPESRFGVGDRIDPLLLLKDLVDGWRTVAITTSFCVFAAIVYLHIAPPYYTATLLLSPTQSQTQGVQGNLGELASLAGINLNRGQGASPYVLFPYVLTSRVVADDLQQHAPDVMPVIFRNQWDVEAGRWRKPDGPIYWLITAVKSLLGLPTGNWAPPGSAELQQYIDSNVVVVSTNQKPVLSLAFSHKNPEFAAHFLQAVYESTDRVLRRMILDRSSKYAGYIEQKLLTVQLTELRQVLTQSLNEQETLIMMGSSNTPFAAQPLGEAVSSNKPTSPNVPIVLALGLLLGLVIGSAAVLLNLRLEQLFLLRGRKSILPRIEKRRRPMESR